MAKCVGVSLPDAGRKRSVHFRFLLLFFIHRNIKFVRENAVWLPLVLGDLDTHALVSLSLGHSESGGEATGAVGPDVVIVTRTTSLIETKFSYSWR